MVSLFNLITMTLPLPLELSFIVDTPFISLKEAFGLPLIFLPFVPLSFSSIPRNTIIGDLTLLISPLPLAQCTGLKKGELSKGDSSVVEDNYLLDQKNLP